MSERGKLVVNFDPVKDYTQFPGMHRVRVSLSTVCLHPGTAKISVYTFYVPSRLKVFGVC